MRQTDTWAWAIIQRDNPEALLYDPPTEMMCLYNTRKMARLDRQKEERVIKVTITWEVK